MGVPFTVATTPGSSAADPETSWGVACETGTGGSAGGVSVHSGTAVGISAGGATVSWGAAGAAIVGASATPPGGSGVVMAQPANSQAQNNTVTTAIRRLIKEPPRAECVRRSTIGVTATPAGARPRPWGATTEAKRRSGAGSGDEDTVIKQGVLQSPGPKYRGGRANCQRRPVRR